MRTCIDIRLSQTRIAAANQYNYGHPATAIHVSTSSIICLLLLFLSSLVHVPLANAGSSPPNTIPRSTNHHRTTFSDPAGVHAGDAPAPLSYPPWTPSSQIDDDGFLKCRYTLLPGEWEAEASIGGRHGPTSKRYRTLHHVPVAVRQVPGDGNCLFHSIATCLAYAANGTHVCMRDPSDLVAAYAPPPPRPSTASRRRDEGAEAGGGTPRAGSPTSHKAMAAQLRQPALQAALASALWQVLHEHNGHQLLAPPAPK